MNPKQRAAEAAIPHLASNTVIGLGTGSTADCFLVALAQALHTRRLAGIRGVPTSLQSEHRARELGIPLIDPASLPPIDVTVDGADEVAPDLSLIKGLGGALLREKIVAQQSARLIIIADESKVVGRLGEKCPLPVEVVQFAHEAAAAFLRAQGGEPVLRRVPGGNPFVTDNGNFIYDCRFPPITEPALLEDRLARRAGIVESGLFVGLASLAIIASTTGVRTIGR